MSGKEEGENNIVLTIDLKINGKILHSIECWRTESLKNKNQIYSYKIEGVPDQIIKHNYKDGAIKLAIKVLKALDEEVNTMKLCTKCGKTKTKMGICGDCKWKETVKIDFKSPYKEGRGEITRILGWDSQTKKGK